MSMNLACMQMELWQTPTEMTLQCNPKNWVATKARYVQWVKEWSDGSPEDEAIVKDHLDLLNSFKHLNFYII